MKKLLPQLRKQLGFTMIELLIVIAILGILAVAVLSAINPIEQINRGRDTGSGSDAEQLISAIDRFYAMKGFYPWQNGANDDGVGIAWSEVDETLVAALAGTQTHGTEDENTCPILYRLSETTSVASGCDGEDGALELKVGFVNKVIDGNYNDLYIYNSGGTASSTYVCFRPQSNSFMQEAFDRADTYPVADPDGAVDASDTLPVVDFPASAILNTTDCGPDGICSCLP